MERDYKAIHAVDLAAAAAAVQKAEADWPEKKNDLESRLATARAIQTRSDELWQIHHRGAARRRCQRLRQGRFRHAVRGGGHAEDGRRGIAQADRATQDAERAVVPILGQDPGGYGDRAAAATRASTTRRSRPCALRSPMPRARAARPPATRNGWTFRKRNTRRWKRTWEWRSNTSPRESTTPKASASRNRPASPTWRRRDRATSTDTGRQSNGTSFWVFYGQYALMRDLLFNRSYRPLDYREYHDYYTYRQRNETYYGRDTATQAPKYGTSRYRRRRSAIPAARLPRAAASRIPSTPASRADIAIRSTPRRWRATRTQITVRANSGPGAAVRRSTARRAASHAILPAGADAVSPVDAAQSGPQFRAETVV